MNFRPFTDAEAWMLFKIAAFAEAVGWTMLILGVAAERLPVSWNEIPVQLAGRTHGMLFLTYIFAVIALSPSLGWSGFRILVAGACSVPPYGSLIYEMLSAQHRKWTDYTRLRTSLFLKRTASEP
jgi:integral membrane protein